MGCNCGKQARPLGSGGSQQTPTKTTSPTYPPPSGLQRSFTLQKRDGSTAVFGSNLEAQAARVRAGGGTVQRIR